MNKNDTVMTSTDLLFEHLADPSKLLPIQTNAKIVHNNHSDHEDSYMVDQNNDKNDNYDHKFKSRSRSRSKSKSKSEKNSSSPPIPTNNRPPNVQPINFNFLNKSDEKPLRFTSEEQIHEKPKIYTSEEKPKHRSEERMHQEKPKHRSDERSRSRHNSEKPSPPPIPKKVLEKQLRLKKMEVLTKLISIKNAGIELTSSYNMNSDLEEMEAELKYLNQIQNKKNTVELTKSFMFNGISALEMLNEKYDPFGFRLKGWSNQVKMASESYNDVVAELLDKYYKNGDNLGPELKLLGMIVMSGVSYHFLTQAPVLNDVMKNNPELFTKIQKNLFNKNISGKNEYDKTKETYNNLKKMQEQKKKQKQQSQNQSQTQSQTYTQSQTQNNQRPTPQNFQKPPQQQNFQRPPIINPTQTQSKPSSVTNLLNDLRKSMPFDSQADSITIGNTIDTETDSSTVKRTVSDNVKTRSRKI